MRSYSSLSLGFLLTGLVSSGCGGQEEEKGDVSQKVQELLPGYWSAETSEEYPPISCSSGYVVDALSCRGSYCDNVRLHCGQLNRAITAVNWTPYFSEEGQSYQICPSGQFLIGVACRGGYCDNMSLQCASLAGTGRSNACYWTPFFSEEQGYSYLADSYYAAGLQCRGSYCDNLSIYACKTN
jgi:hypothetical protein